MPIHQIQVVECDECHRLQDTKLAEYIEFEGTVSWVRPPNAKNEYSSKFPIRKDLLPKNLQPIGVDAKGCESKPHTILCINCAMELLRTLTE